MRASEFLRAARYPLGALIPFLIGLHFLSAAAEVFAPTLRGVFSSSITGDAGAMGMAWLATYVLLNGSIAAAVAVSLFASGVLSAGQLLLMITGSRFGATSFLVLLGVLERFHKPSLTWRRSLGLAVLTLIVTGALYTPATLLGYLTLPTSEGLLASLAAAAPPLPSPGAISRLTAEFTRAVGPFVPAAIGLILMLGGLAIADHGIDRLDPARLRGQLDRVVRHSWTGFLAGLLVTVLGASVAFSVALLVPLYTRGLLNRREVIPYILGANIGTLGDTLLVTVMVGSPLAGALVLWLGLAVSAIAVFLLLIGDAFTEVTERAFEALTRGRRGLTALLAFLFLLPVLLVLLR